jgi:uncharacterized protein
VSLNLFVIQGTSGCNLDCSYCYLPRSARAQHTRIGSDVLSRGARLVLSSSLLADRVTVLWHAGEPLALPKEDFVRSVSIIESENVHGRDLDYSIQTNATLINEDWCDIFEALSIQVGISADGPSHIHDRTRRDWNGHATFDRVQRGIDTLRKRRIPFSGICVLTDYSLDFPDEIYDHFLSSGYNGLGFNLEELEAACRSSSLENLRDVEPRFTAFFNRIVQRWMADGGILPIRELDHLASKETTKRTRPGFVAVQDVSQGLKMITLRADGSFITFSPELASGTDENPDAFVVGHVDTLEYLEDIFADRRYLALRAEINKGKKLCEQECGHFQVCGGGWPSNKYFENGSFATSETMVCRLQVKTLYKVMANLFFTRQEFASGIEGYKRGLSMQCEA